MRNGEGGIRTRGTASGTLVFETSSISHSDTSPCGCLTGPAHPANRRLATPRGKLPVSIVHIVPYIHRSASKNWLIRFSTHFRDFAVSHDWGRQVCGKTTGKAKMRLGGWTTLPSTAEDAEGRRVGEDAHGSATGQRYAPPAACLTPRHKATKEEVGLPCVPPQCNAIHTNQRNR
mgnify:CR=1 FL=1